MARFDNSSFNARMASQVLTCLGSTSISQPPMSNPTRLELRAPTRPMHGMRLQLSSPKLFAVVQFIVVALVSIGLSVGHIYLFSLFKRNHNSINCFSCHYTTPLKVSSVFAAIIKSLICKPFILCVHHHTVRAPYSTSIAG